MIQHAHDDKMLDQSDSHPAINLGLSIKLRLTVWEHSQTNDDESTQKGWLVWINDERSRCKWQELMPIWCRKYQTIKTEMKNMMRSGEWMAETELGDWGQTILGFWNEHW